MHKLFKSIFSKQFSLVFLVLLQLIIIILLSLYASNYFWWTTFAFKMVGILFSIYIINSKSEDSYKISWIFFIFLVPLFGIFCYLIFAKKRVPKRIKRQYDELNKIIDVANKKGRSNNYIEDINTEKDAAAYGTCKYLDEYAYASLYKNTRVSYYGFGQDGFPHMLEKLKQAKHFIFIEYFIIHMGSMWADILSILVEKAKEGVDIRILYDDFGSLNLPSHYDKRLRKLGIKAFRVNILRPFLDVRMNNRDHRKIMIIDGYIGFTGGINLGDEYINKKERFGIWKDNIIMLEGDGVFGLTKLFLSNYHNYDDSEIDYEKYAPKMYQHEGGIIFNPSGYVQPYGTLPNIDENIGESVYVNLCLRAKKYIYITTPYVALDATLKAAIQLAAKNGVQVKLLTPHIPDKKYAFQLTRSYYGDLLKAGVKIFEYLPGFVHAKTFVVDGEIATVGTINLDYRSLFLHFENGCLLYKCDCIKDIEHDLNKTLLTCLEYTQDMYDRTPWRTHLLRSLLRIVAPLF